MKDALTFLSLFASFWISFSQNCLIPSSADLCQVCGSGYYNNDPFGPSSFKNENCVPKKNNSLITVVTCYVLSKSNTLSSETQTTLRKQYKIYDSFLEALQKEDLESKSLLYGKIISIKLLLGTHFILEGDLVSFSPSFFERNPSELIVEPLFCSEAPSEMTALCFENETFARIIIKTTRLNLFVSYRMTFRYLLLDGIDLPLYLRGDPCKDEAKICCQVAREGCTVIKRSFYFWENANTIGLFNIEPLIDWPSAPPQLVISNCFFSSLIFGVSEKGDTANQIPSSFVSLFEFGGVVKISDSNFNDNFFSGALIYKNSAIRKIYDLTVNGVSFYFNFSSAFSDVLISKSAIYNYNRVENDVFESNGVSLSTISSLFLLLNFKGVFALDTNAIYKVSMVNQHMLLNRNTKTTQVGQLTIKNNNINNNYFKNMVSLKDDYLRMTVSCLFSGNIIDYNTVRIVMEQQHVKQSIFSGTFTQTFSLPLDTLIKTSYSVLQILDSNFSGLKTTTLEYSLIKEVSAYPVTIDTLFTTAKRKLGVYYTNDTTTIRNCLFQAITVLLFNAPLPIFRLTIDFCRFENIDLRMHHYKPFIDLIPEGLFIMSNTFMRNYTSESQVFYLRCFLNASLSNLTIQDFRLINSDVFRISSSTTGDRWEHQLNISNFSATSTLLTLTPDSVGKLFVCIFCVWSVESGKGVAVTLYNLTIINVFINVNNIKHHVLRFDNVYLKAENIYGKNVSNFIFLTHSPKTATSDIYVDRLEIINNEGSPLIRLFDFGVSAFTRADFTNSYFLCDNITFNTAGGFNLAQKLVLSNLTFDLYQESGTLLFSQITKASTISAKEIKIKSKPNSKASLFTIQTTESSDANIPWSNTSLLEIMFSNRSLQNFGFANSLFESSYNGAIVLLVQSQIIFSNCSFKNLIASEGSVIRLTQNSKAVFYNCSVSKVYATSFGGAFFVESSQLVAIGLSLDQAGSKVTGGMVTIIDSDMFLKNSVFVNCGSSIGGTIFADNSLTSIKNTNFINSTASKYGAHIVAKQGNLGIEGAVFNSGKALNLGASLYLEGVLFIVRQSEFIACESRIGVIYSVNGNEDKVSILENVRFYKNSVVGSGALLYTSDVNLKITILDAQNNKASAGYLFVMFGSFLKPTLNIESLRLTENSMTDGIFSLVDVNLAVTSFVLFNNYLYKDSFLTIRNSRLTLKYMYFASLSKANQIDFNQEYFIFFIKSRYSDIYITGCSIEMRYHIGFLDCNYCPSVTTSLSSFNQGFGERGGVLKLLHSSWISERCLFSNNTASQGGAVYATSTSITLEFTSLFKNEAQLHGSDLSVANDDNNEASSVNIFDSLLSGILGVSNKLNDIDIKINRTAFYGSKGVDTQALFIANSNYVNISNSIFSNFFNNSVILIINSGAKSSKIKVSYTTFFDSYSLHSPGAFIRTVGNTEMKINDCNFTGGYSIRGGAIYFSCKTENCPLQVSETFFQNNLAQEMGGALSSESLNVTDENSKFINNEAPVGSDKNFFPTKFATFLPREKVNMSSSHMISYLKNGPNENCTLLGDNPIKVVPGYEFTFGVVVLDKGDNIQYSESGFMARINVNKDYKNGLATTHSLTNNLAEINNGSGVFKSVILVGDTKTTITATINYYNGKHSINENVTIIVVGCKRGDSYYDKKCQPCPEHFYSINPYPESNNQSCQKCPENSYCPGGDTIIPLQYYWRKDSNSSLVLQCKSRDGCPEQNRTEIVSINYVYKCSLGYEGNMCEGCSLGYGNVKNQCLECTNTRPFFIFLILSGFIIYLVYVYIQEKSSVKQSTDQDIALMKILVNHTAIFVMLSAIKVNWSQYFKDFFTISSTYASTSPSTVFSFDCLFEWTPDEKLVNTLMIAGFTPVFLNILCFLLNLLINLIKHALKRKIHEHMNFHQYLRLHFKRNWLFSEFLKHMTIIFFNIYPQVLLAMFKVFGCKTLDDTDDKYLVQFPWVRCNSTFHKNTWSASIFFIIVWGVVAPSLISLMVWRAFRRKKTKIKEKDTKLFENFELEIAQEGSKRIEFLEGDLSKLNRMVILNFATRGYKLHFYWWEITIFTRKILFLCIATFSEEMDNISIGGMTMYLLIFYLLFNLWIKPYVSDKLNLLETASLLISIVSIAMGLITSMGEEVGTLLKIICSIVLLVINMAFFAVWALLYSNKLARKLLPTLRNIKRATKADINVMKLKANKQAPVVKQVEIADSKRR